jgi:hypothetical protein
MLKIIIRGLFALPFMALIGLGVHFLLQQQHTVEALSEQTTATVTGKQVVRRSGRSTDNKGRSRHTTYYRPVVSYQFEVGDRAFTSDRIFPHDFEIGGGLGGLSAKAPLDGFAVGQETTAYYNPDDPSQACLIRRPSFGSYVMVLGGTVALGLILGTLRVQDDAKRLRGQVTAALWYIVGLGAAWHYWSLAGMDSGGVAALLFTLYAVLGLFPLSAAVGGSKSSTLAARLHAGALGFLVGAFVGLWVGLGLCIASIWFFRASATFGVRCQGYGIAIPAMVCLLIGLFAKGDATQGEEEEDEEEPAAQSLGR